MKKLAGITAALAVMALIPASAMAGDKCFGESPKKVGTKGNDVIWGTSGDDVIWAGPGDDVIYGLGGNDKICAGGGNDKVFGGRGNDKVWGASGDDKIHGGNGNDVLFGVWGNDSINGGKGVDKSREGARWGGVRMAEVPRVIRPEVQLVEGAAFRIKGQYGGNELYAGYGGLGSGDVRNETNFDALGPGGEFKVEVSFDAETEVITGKVSTVFAPAVSTSSATVSYDLTDKPLGCPIEDWDVMQVLVRENGNSVSFEDAKMYVRNRSKGEPFGKDLDKSGASVWGGSANVWAVMDVDFSRDWRITGKLVSDGAFQRDERTKLQFTVGCKTHPDRSFE